MKALGFRSARSVQLMVEAMRPRLSRPQHLARRPGLCRQPARPAAVEGLRGRHPRRDRGRARGASSRPPPAPARKGRDDPLFGGRRRRQRGRGDLHDQRLFRRRGDGAGHRLSAQQRDGRFHGKARHAQPVRARPGRGQRDRARQAAALVDGADPGREGRQGRARARQPRRPAHHHRGARNDHEHRRLRHGAAAGGRRAALPPPMAARTAVYYERGGLSPETAAALAGNGLQARRAAAVGCGRADRDRPTAGSRASATPAARPAPRSGIDLLETLDT